MMKKKMMILKIIENKHRDIDSIRKDLGNVPVDGPDLYLRVLSRKTRKYQASLARRAKRRENRKLKHANSKPWMG